MPKPVVLITSATSRNGSEAAKLLLAQGKHTVRLSARDPSKLADQLVSQGAEAVALDPASLESVAQACAGADIVYLILPTLVGDMETIMFRNFLQAATAPGSSVRHIVYLSAVDAADPAQAGFQPIHSHYKHEQALKRSGVPFTSLRPAWFHENQVMYHAQSVRRAGEFRTSAGDGVWTSVAVRDIAAAAAAVISNPEPHTGKIYTLTTEAVTDKMIAEKISKVTGQSVRHVNMTPEEHRNLILQNLSGDRSSAKKPEDFATGLVALDWQKRMSLFSKVHPDLEELIGRKGVSLEAFLAENADAFKQQAPESA
jgi:NAD(P)H dehydrogenase (quinone)